MIKIVDFTTKYLFSKKIPIYTYIYNILFPIVPEAIQTIGFRF